MLQKALTIGIPAYNMEKYIGRCLDSVVSSKHLDKLDIIVVNDGSRDATLEMARKYENLYPESVRIIDKPNGGWGTAINRSIAEAQGVYYKSLDSDDWFDTMSLDRFVELLENVDADMVLTSFNEVNNRGERTGGIQWEDYINRQYPFDEYLRKLNGRYYNTIHAITYKTAILRDNHVIVSERFYGDLDYINTPLVHVKSVFVSPLNIYQYFVGREGQSISIAGYKAHIDDYLAVACKAADLYGKLPETVNREVQTVLWKETVVRSLWAYKLLMLPMYLGKEKSSNRRLKAFDNFLKRNNPILYKELGKERIKGVIPYIWIWRIFGVNMYKLTR